MTYGLLELDQLRFPEKQRMQLVLWTWSNAIRTVVVEGFTKSGLIHFTDTTTADRAVNEATEDILELPIAVHVRLGSTSYDARRGECYAKLMLLLGTYQHVLCQGYLCDRMHTLTYPGGTHEHSVSGKGITKYVLGTDPAAGLEVSETVPTNVRWKLKALWLRLVCDATVINRTPSIVIDNGTSEIWRLENDAFSTLAASASGTYELSENLFPRGGANLTNRYGLPHDLDLYQGWRLRTETENIQAGDNWAAPHLTLEEWIEE